MKNVKFCFLFVLLSVTVMVGFTACTDYVDVMEAEYGYLRSGNKQYSSERYFSSSSVSTSVSSSSFLAVRTSCDVKNDENCMKDIRDGQNYKTVTIGAQTWMAENLNYAYTGAPYNYSGYTSDSTSWCYSNAAVNCSKYGRLYTWAAAMDSVGTWPANGKGCGLGKTCSPTYPVRGVCPEGWHLPTQTEWNTLFTAVGGQSTAGKMLKSTSGWYSSGNGTDAYSFSALPAGLRNRNGGYNYEGYGAYFWSSTEDDSNYAYSMYLDYSNDNAGQDNDFKDYGFSVRCVKDDGETAKSSSSVTPPSSSSATSVSTSTMTDTRDGQTYKTVSIGTQTWMAENLNYAYTDVPYNYSGYTSDSTSWCYSNAAANCTKYGRLYTWAAAMDSVGTWSANGKGCGYNKTCSPTYPVRGVCPEGWHLPTQTEWKTLFTAVGGSSTAGKMLKSTSGWNSSGNGTDAYSFSALPAGYRDDDGYYDLEGLDADFWGSTEDYSNLAYKMNLEYGDDYAYLGVNYKSRGFSVRCVKD